MKILNQKNTMEYRRFGKTELMLSAVTLGGMRYKHGWDKPRDEIPREMIDNAIECVNLALELGINHIETAQGYMKSEKCHGIVLNEELKLSRDSYYLMTKGAPQSAAEVRAFVEKQLSDLQTDYIDTYAYHGINNHEIFLNACKKDGPVEELLKMKEEGILRHIGFSTHAPLEVICESIETDLFEFVNLHYYYFYQRNYAAIALAEKRDMGVFIISPNDKGGQLFNPPQLLKDMTAPSTPIQWNARFCLAHPSVSTLSFGMTEKSHFEEMAGLFPSSVPFSVSDQKIKCALDCRLTEDEYATYEGYDIQNDPSRINIPEVLRFRKMWKCYDMIDFGKYRYNMLQQHDHWFPGLFATEENIATMDESKFPEHVPVKELLREAHSAFYIEKKEK